MKIKPVKNLHFKLFLLAAVISFFTMPLNLVHAAAFTELAQSVVTIGNPPTECPKGWPLTHGYITQGPLGSVSHGKLYPIGEQAIDIGNNPLGTPTFATFSGRVVVAQNFDDAHYGIHVDIESVCDGKTFKARWAHLNSINAPVTVGAHVTAGQEIGKIDSTGNSTGTHLHYSFIGLNMGTPYIPQNPAYPSCQSDDGSACAVKW